MVVNTGIKVPTNSIACGDNIKVSMIAEGAGVTPGLAVMKGTADNQVVVCTVGSLSFMGIADLNRNARARTNVALTTAYTAGDQLEVIIWGFVKVIADTRGITCGTEVGVGEATSGRISDNAYTAPPAGNTYTTAGMAASLLVRDQIIGAAFTTAASGNAAVIFLGKLA
jgi:hypothetical protein